tara:strand:- start:2932 stop:3093 length:162 start_codon:yes stop_codon:yes gene_type:complete
MNGTIKIVDSNPSGVIISDSSSSSNTGGGGYGYNLELLINDSFNDTPVISYDI